NFQGKYVEPWAVLRTSNPINLPYAFSKYQITAGQKHLSNSIETIYNENGTSNSILTKYTYNSHGLVSSVTSSTSDGGHRSLQFKYPFDYSGNTVLSQMA